jgi:MFS family permease
MYYGALAALSPFLPVLLRSVHGLSATEVGLVTALTPLLMTAFSPAWGALCDARGVDGPVLVVTMLISCAGRLAIAFGGSWSDGNGSAGGEDNQSDGGSSSSSSSSSMLGFWGVVALVAVGDSFGAGTGSTADACVVRVAGNVRGGDPGAAPQVQLLELVGTSSDDVESTYDEDDSHPQLGASSMGNGQDQSSAGSNVQSQDACTVVPAVQSQVTLVSPPPPPPPEVADTVPILGATAAVDGSVETWPSYGEQRLFGAIGWGVIAPVASIGLGWGLHTAVHAVLIVGAIAPALQLARQSPRRHRPRRPRKTERTTGGIIGDGQRHDTETETGDHDNHDDHAAGIVAAVKILLATPATACFAAIVFVLGCGFGMINTVLFLHLDDLGATDLLMGLSLAVTCAAEVPVFLAADRITARLGVDGVILVSAAAYAGRMLWYAYVVTLNPWLVLPAEVLHGLTYALAWTACVSVAAGLGDTHGNGSTMQGLLSAIHFGAGYAAGGCIGGALVDRLGASGTFAWFAAGMTAAAVAYAVSVRAFGAPVTQRPRQEFDAVSH